MTDTDTDYRAFLDRKTHLGNQSGFAPVFMPDFLFPFQRALITWAIEKGRAAIFADCGLGKTPMQLVWAQNVVEKTGKPVLILTPLSVGAQTIREAEKFGIEAKQSRDGTIAAPITVTNYQQLHKFDWQQFGGVVCDESSILKNFDGAIKGQVTDFMRKLPYRLLCTATAAPNDYIELGTSSEALGELGYMDMLSRFFKNGTNSLHPSIAKDKKQHEMAKWRFRGHAEQDFWRWVCSWSRAVRRPSDLGFDDGSFRLPDLRIRQHMVRADSPREGFLFSLPAVGLAEQRSDLRRTIGQRCEMVSQICNSHNLPAVAWCNLNEEGNRLAKEIKGAVQVTGSDSEEHKEETFNGFVKGDIRVLVTKPVIGGFGLNLQHCAHQTFFPSHSYEQYYQAVRRCWRFGQKNPVIVDIITTDGQENVMANLQRKSDAAHIMFDNLVGMMWNELKIQKRNDYIQKEKVPTWL